jgi:hypothetical protein
MGMSQARSLCFDALEERKLLSRGHVVAHVRHAPVAVPLVISGTLTVSTKGSTTTMDEQGDTTTSTPVSGQLGALGNFRGIWNESDDTEGDYEGPDTIQLHNAKGSFIIAFNADNPGQQHREAGGILQYDHSQILYSGKGAYARGKESGSIALTTNAARSIVETMTISTQST